MSRPWQSPTPLIQQKIRWTVLLVTVVFALLLLRLWYLQVLEGRYYATLSASNRLRIRSVEAPRGFILDRSGEVIVENRPSFDVYVIPAAVPDLDEAAHAIGTVLGQAPEEIVAKMVEGRLRKYYQEVCLLDQTFVIDGDASVGKAVEAIGNDLGAAVTVTQFERYQLGEGIDKREADFAAEVAATLES